jgi:glucan phosphoethanolaminetransferase (alkaline phosphatase superfamily)
MNRMILRTLALFFVLLWLAFFFPLGALIVLGVVVILIAGFAYYESLKGL